jgi:hypothetical protein
MAGLRNSGVDTSGSVGSNRRTVFSANSLLCIWRVEVAGGWRTLHNEELYNLCPSPSIIRVVKSRRMRLAGHVARMGELRNAYKTLERKCKGKRPVGRPRRRWEDNIRIHVREIAREGVYWIRVVQDRDQWRAFVNTVMYLRVL